MTIPSGQPCGGELRLAPRYDLSPEAIILITADRLRVFLGSIRNISRTGLGISTRQQLEPGQTLSTRCHLQEQGAIAVTEDLPVAVIWSRPNCTGLRFSEPLLLVQESPTAGKALYRIAYLNKKKLAREH